MTHSVPLRRRPGRPHAPAALVLGLALCAASAAPADIAPDGLWRHWQTLAAAGGGTLAADVARDDGALRLDAPALTLGDGAAAVTLSVDGARIVREDGESVLIVDPGSILTLSRPGTGAAPLEILLGGSGLRLRASGALPAPDYALTSARLILDLLAGAADRAPGTPELFALTLDGLEADLTGLGSGGAVTLDGTLASVRLRSEGESPETGTRGALDATQTGVRWSAALLPDPDPQAPAGATLSLAADALTAESRIAPAGGRPTRIAATGGGSRLGLSVEGGRAFIGSSAEGLQLEVSGGGLPVPSLGLALGGAAVEMTLPVGIPAAEAPEAGARLALRLDQLTADETLWARLDPAGALPRSAADLDLTAAARLAVAAPDGPGGAPRLLPTEITLQDLSLRFAEAELSADGRFDTGAALRPAGALDVTVVGGEALLGRLSAAGLLTPRVEMGARMMIGLFATPGEGDRLSMRIETEDDGGLVFNGLRLR